MATYEFNVIVLRDFERLVYIAGIKSIGNYSASVTALRRLCASLGTRRLVTTGNSGGGAAAMLYGADLGARRALAFAPPTDFDLAMSYLGPLVRKRLISLRDNGCIVWPDAPAVLRRVPEMESEIYYGAKNAVDRKHARFVAGLPNVRQFAIDDVDTHGVVLAMAAQGRLAAAFHTLVGARGRDDGQTLHS
jgi:pimeloyl-ACP methyl ester carboxylesterase